MNKIIKFSALVILGLILANFTSEQKETSTNDYHAINIWGKITTVQNQTYDVENISISGAYEDIWFYAKPTKKNVDPSTNRTPINLVDIKLIMPIISPDKSPVAYVYKNREYIEIELEWKLSKKRDKFIIERDKRVNCYESVKPKQKKDIALEAVAKLEIRGYHYRDDKARNRSEFAKINEQLTELKNNIKKIEQADLREKIETNISELSDAVQAAC